MCHRGGLLTLCTVTYVIDILYETSASLSCGNKFNKGINVANILMINSHGDVILIIWNCILRLNQCTFAPTYFPIYRDLQRDIILNIFSLLKFNLFGFFEGGGTKFCPVSHRPSLSACFDLSDSKNKNVK